MGIYKTVQTSLWNVVTKALSYEFPNTVVIHSYQNGIEPKTTYVALNLLQLQQVGHASVSTLTSTTEKLSFGVTYQVDVQVSFFGENSGDAISSLVQNINNNPLVLEEIKKNNLGFLRKSVVRNNPQKRDTVWVDSFNITLTFNFIVGNEQLVDVVENVVLENSYDYQAQGWLVSGNGSILGVDWMPDYDGTSLLFNGDSTYTATYSYTVTPNT